MENEKLEKMYTYAEAQAYLRVSRITIYRLIKQGKLKAHKVGGLYRFYGSDLRACVRPGKEQAV